MYKLTENNKAKNKQISSRVNLPYSLAIKFCLKFANIVLEQPDIFEKIEIISESFSNIENRLLKNLDIRKIKHAKVVNFKGTKYKTHFYLIKNAFDEIYKIEDILVYDQKNIFIICTKYEIIGFNEHLISYQIGNEISNNLYNIPITDFKYPPTNLHKIRNTLYFRLRTF